MRKPVVYLIIRSVVIIIPILLLASCASSASRQQYAESEMWAVELISAETADSLLATEAAQQYGGGVVTTETEIAPTDGFLFLLLEMRITKIGEGRASFSWNDAHIADSDGNTYYRHPNDTFLSNLNIPRLRSIDIVLGSENGFACFEVPATATDLRFKADEGRISIEID